ncbi:MAG: segregation/condensation protein A [Planctomycetes bacterium]|nr:segregation/condensation protein A [Planctomycetota bacterium]
MAEEMGIRRFFKMSLSFPGRPKPCKITPMGEYRVNLDIYNGPLDLLLFLIRREEVDIYDIPIARITEQYCQYVQVLKQLDPNLAGDFLVLAATLIEVKTRMLLPAPPPEEGGESGLQIDPRAELVRQLLEYKAFKDAAGELAAAADEHSMRFPRRPPEIESSRKEYDLEDVQIWDLFEAFNRVLQSIGATLRQHEVIYDDTPIELHAADILDRLGRDGPLTFRGIFEGRTSRSEIVGLFIAMLEMIRQKKIFAAQESNFGEILIRINPDPPDERPNFDARAEDGQQAIAAQAGGEKSDGAGRKPAEPLPGRVGRADADDENQYEFDDQAETPEVAKHEPSDDAPEASDGRPEPTYDNDAGTEPQPPEH